MATSPREKIMLESTGTNKKGNPTKYFYTTHLNKRNTTEKLEIMKYDPRAWNEAAGHNGKHVKFKQKKVPK